MDIRLSDSHHIPDLLAYLRAGGCIAYLTGGADVIEALLPYADAGDEDGEIKRLLQLWLAANPTARLL
jgi:hypothetical protein